MNAVPDLCMFDPVGCKAGRSNLTGVHGTRHNDFLSFVYRTSFHSNFPARRYLDGFAQLSSIGRRFFIRVLRHP